MRILFWIASWLLVIIQLSAQKQNNQWRFGYGSAIDFNSIPVTYPNGTALPTLNPPVQTGTYIEGTASIADKNTGALLFYTDGQTVWNANNQPMPNGSGLAGSDLLSSYMGTIIVPVPGSCTKYYIFCTDDGELGQKGLTYSVVDMTLDNGLGDVIPGKKEISLFVNVSEMLMAYPKRNGDGYWILTNGANFSNSELAAFEITAQGIDTTPVLSTITNAAFTGKINPQGTRFVTIGNNGSGIELFDFDAATGQVSNPVSIPQFLTNDVLKYFEFSPNGNYLYASGDFNFYQFDISSGISATILASATPINFGPPGSYFGTPQLAANGKLYVVKNPFVYGIENPNNPAATVGPIVGLPNNVSTMVSLPQWIYLLPETNYQGLITTTTDSCVQTTQIFSISDISSVLSVLWNFGDSASASSNTATGFNVSHNFSQTGNFTITAILTTDCGIDTLTSNIAIRNCSQPCSANIVVSPDSCIQTIISFSLQSTDSIISASWDFDDAMSLFGDTSNLLNPGYVFMYQGTYHVSCIVNLSCGIDTVFYMINISNCTSAPYESNIIALGDTCLGDSVRFSININRFIQRVVEWDFGDPISGAANTAVGFNPIHTYSDTGTYVVRLILEVFSAAPSNPAFFVDTIYFTVNINNCTLPCDVFINSTAGIPCQGSELFFSLNSDSPIDSVIWNFDDPSSGSDNTTSSLSANHIFNAAGLYRVSAIVSLNCGRDTAFLLVNINDCDTLENECLVDLPTAFTPNGDGNNDFFFPISACSYETYELVIYNRWGQTVYKSENPAEKWDGKYIGAECPRELYPYVLKYSSIDNVSKLYRGVLTLLR